MIAVVSLLCFTVMPVLGYQNGAPPSVCDTLAPKHSGKEPQTGVSPYKITAVLPMENQSIIVTVSATTPKGTFQGFILQGRSSDQPLVPLGKFFIVPPEAKTLNCGSGKENTVTHKSSNSKSSLKFEWQPPEGFKGSVVFEGTILQDYGTFWTGVRTDKLDFFDPILLATPRPLIEGVSDPLVEGCSADKVCFGVPQGCGGRTSCNAFVTCQVDSDVAEFEMTAQIAGYVAVGLSDDGKMGKDSVVECVRHTPGDKVELFMSWNSETGKANTRLPDPAQKYGVTLLSGSYTNSLISCKFTRPINTTIKGVEFFLARDPQYILVAVGNTALETGISYHDRAFAATGSAQLLSIGGVSLGRDPKVLQRLHAAVMLFAWIGAASIGILLARYFKQTWVGSQLCAKAQWFAWHQALMAATWLLTIVGFIVIFAEVQGWSGFDSPHPILGVITTALAFVQPFMAFLRPAPDSPKRPIFNWAHWTVGNLAHLLAVVTIFFATKLEDADLPMWFIWLLVGYVVFYLFIHLLLTIAARSSAKKLSESANGDVQMTNLRGPNTPPAPAQMSDAPHSKLRKLVFGLFLVVIISLTVVLIVVAILSPIS